MSYFRKSGPGLFLSSHPALNYIRSGNTLRKTARYKNHQQHPSSPVLHSWRANHTRNFSSSFVISPIRKHTEVQIYFSICVIYCLIIFHSSCSVALLPPWIAFGIDHAIMRNYFTLYSWLIHSILSIL